MLKMIQTAIRLTLRPFIWTHDGPVSSPDDPPAAYFVDGMTNNLIVQIINKRAHRREPLWHIRYVGLDAEIGEYNTAEDALAALQELVDEPTGLELVLHRTEAEWQTIWGKVPESALAKINRKTVLALKRVIKVTYKSRGVALCAANEECLERAFQKCTIGEHDTCAAHSGQCVECEARKANTA
jgi:hypothetical protein